jgi:hypothetical protein
MPALVTLQTRLQLIRLMLSLLLLDMFAGSGSSKDKITDENEATG